MVQHICPQLGIVLSYLLLLFCCLLSADSIISGHFLQRSHETEDAVEAAIAFIRQWNRDHQPGIPYFSTNGPARRSALGTNLIACFDASKRQRGPQSGVRLNAAPRQPVTGGLCCGATGRGGRVPACGRTCERALPLVKNWRSQVGKLKG